MSFRINLRAQRNNRTAAQTQYNEARLHNVIYFWEIRSWEPVWYMPFRLVTIYGTMARNIWGRRKRNLTPQTKAILYAAIDYF